MRFYPWLFLLASLAVGVQAAQIYQYTDEHGNLVFTDKPPIHLDAEEIKLPEVNRTMLPVTPPEQSRPEDSASAPGNPYNQLTISNLPDAESIRANNGSFPVQVIVQPRLAPGHRLQLLVDGQPHGEAVAGTLLQAHNLDRGEHSLAIQVLAGQQVVQQSSGVQVSVQRTHVNAPARRTR